MNQTNRGARSRYLKARKRHRLVIAYVRIVQYKNNRGALHILETDAPAPLPYIYYNVCSIDPTEIKQL